MRPQVAIVVPCFNEARRLPAARFEAFVHREEGVHLFLVDDGSTDDTRARLDALAARLPGRVEVLHLPENRGKAEAVRTGMRAALGRPFDYAGYWDADLSTPLEELARFVGTLEAQPELLAALGSRVQLLGRSIERRPVRHYSGRVFATLASATLGLAVYDTQCGAKLFRNTEAVGRLFDQPFLTGWTFDVEILARLAAGSSPVAEAVVEIPLRRWRDVGSSHVRASDFFRALRDLLRIRRRYGRNASLRRVGSALLALAVLGCGSGSEPPRRSILLVTIDTLRADALGSYGAGPGVTPNLDRLAAEGTLFERAWAPMALTRPSHFSILTSLPPREHGVLNNATALPESLPTVAESLRDAGFRTAAFTSVSLLSPEAGAARGFETFDAPTEAPQRVAEQVVPRALGWLSLLNRDEPFFLWVHLFDPHMPYVPPRSSQAGHAADPGAARRGLSWSRLITIARQHGGNVPRDTLERARELYAGEVGYADAWFGRLLEGVEAARDARSLLVLVTADHGECFENGVYFEHSYCLHRSALRVPLLVRAPPLFEAGHRESSLVSLLDVAPTILRVAGLEIPEGFRGRPLDRPQPDRAVLLQQPFFQAKVRGSMAARRDIRSVAGDPVAPPALDRTRVGIVQGGWKYVRGGGAEVVVRVLPSPGAPRDAPVPDAVRSRLRTSLEERLEDVPLRIEEAPRLDERLQRELEALGYL